MKTKYFVFFTLLSLTFFSFKSINYNAAISISILQDTTTVEGVYDGHEDYGYNFIVKDNEGVERTLTFQEIDKTDHQVSFYAATKKSTESLAHSYSSLWGLPVTMLRFFTVYGPWGRPDMAYFKFTKRIWF